MDQGSALEHVELLYKDVECHVSRIAAGEGLAVSRVRSGAHSRVKTKELCTVPLPEANWTGGSIGVAINSHQPACKYHSYDWHGMAYGVYLQAGGIAY